MSTFLLVHGAWHGAWCWSKLVPELEALGHKTIVFDLPSHGEDKTPAGDVTLDDYAARWSRNWMQVKIPCCWSGIRWEAW
jgi:pimeloyl-ACP methyl ester carboxylesterase